MFPTQQDPVFIPMPIETGGLIFPSNADFSSRLSLKSFSPFIMARAAVAASSLCFGLSIGAFQKAMIASPMYLSMVPRCLRIISVIGVRYSLIKLVSSVADILSEICVKPLISENIMVISFVSPPSFKRSGSSANFSTRSGDKYRLNAPLTYFFSDSVLRKAMKEPVR